MKVLLTGATGFVGSHLAPALRARGHSVATVGRGAGADHDWSSASLARGVQQSDAIVHLAGENLFGQRWDPEFKQRLWSSRFETTRALAELAEQHRPRVFVSTSAVGYYGAHAAEELDEHSPSGAGFLAELCRDWELALEPAERAGVRCAIVRIGLVLGRESGALARMLPFFRFGLGGPIGDGEQWLSWIHVDDLVRLFCWLVEDGEQRGVFNACAPAPVTMNELARTLGRVLHRPALLRVPAFALRLRFGEAAEALLTGQKVRSARALAGGFRFEHPELGEALEDLLRKRRSGSSA